MRGTSRAFTEYAKHNTTQYVVEDRHCCGKEEHHDDDKRGVDQWFAVRLFACRLGPGVGTFTEQ